MCDSRQPGRRVLCTSVYSVQRRADEVATRPRRASHGVVTTARPSCVVYVCMCIAYNGELMRSLQDRDELHMAQDSMLVDIDDLIRSVSILQTRTAPMAYRRAQGGVLVPNLSVCPSVRPLRSGILWKRLNIISSPHSSPIILVLRVSNTFDGVTIFGGAKYRWGIKISRFSPISCYISQTIQDSAIVTMER